MKMSPITYVLIAGIMILGFIQLLGINGVVGYAYLTGATLITLGFLAAYEVLNTNWKFSMSKSLNDLSSLSPESAERLKSVVIQEVALAILFVPTLFVVDRMSKSLVPLQVDGAGEPYLGIAVFAAMAIFCLMRGVRHIRL